MRIGKRMQEILEVLNASKEALTLTEIIMTIKGLKPYRTHLKQNEKREIVEIEKLWPPFMQRELASALANKSLGSFNGVIGFDRLVETKTGKKYHYFTYADKLYATYTRAIRTLEEERLVVRAFPLEKLPLPRAQHRRTHIYRISPYGARKLKART